MNAKSFRCPLFAVLPLVWMSFLLAGRRLPFSSVRAFSLLPGRSLSAACLSSITSDSKRTSTVAVAKSTFTTRLQSTLVAPDTAANMTDAVTAPPKEYPLEMTEDERYLFDLNGFLIVRGVLTPEEVAAANRAIDNHAHEMVERSEDALRNAKEGTKFFGQGPGRMDLGRCLEWGPEESRVFQSILAHPRLVPLFHGILGKGYRMDHLPLILAQNKGSEGFQLHGGTVDCTSGEYNPHLAYHCHHGTIRSSLLGCNVILEDHNPGDGGFCIVPGSHKSNFKMPKGMVDGEKYEEYIIQPATKAGDVILFSEGTVHGAKSWTSDRQRRTALFRFSPATHVYGRSYFGHEGGGWPAKMYEGLTEAERAVLESPYANRLDRPNIRPDGSVEITQRSERKRQHDQEVFGTKYF
jgi:ectoine hydroxylase-related dioxygenase (phytanoyl-CoA dioxygenase family)